MEIVRYDPHRHEPHAVVREDDTHGVLAAEPVVRPVEAPLETLEQAALRSTGRAPGSAVFLPGRPGHIHAVIHELDQEPTWRADWIVAAALASFTAARRRGLTTLVTPLLGTVHGRATTEQAIDALARALGRAGAAQPHYLLLEDVSAETAAALAQRVASAGDD